MTCSCLYKEIKSLFIGKFIVLSKVIEYDVSNLILVVSIWKITLYLFRYIKAIIYKRRFIPLGINASGLRVPNIVNRFRHVVTLGDSKACWRKLRKMCSTATNGCLRSKTCAWVREIRSLAPYILVNFEETYAVYIASNCFVDNKCPHIRHSMPWDI